MWYKVNKRYIGTQQVRPSWWTPWSDIISYFPFKDDILDKKWNNVIISQYSTPLKQSIWYQFEWNCGIDTKCNFICCRTKIDVNSSQDSAIQIAKLDNIWWLSYYFKSGDTNNNQSFCIYPWSTPSWGIYQKVSTSQWVWYHIWVGYGNWIAYYYFNWQRHQIYQWSVTDFWKVGFFIGFSWHKSKATISDWILWNSARSQEQYTDYYNKTKSKYWL